MSFNQNVIATISLNNLKSYIDSPIKYVKDKLKNSNSKFQEPLFIKAFKINSCLDSGRVWDYDQKMCAEKDDSLKELRELLRVQLKKALVNFQKNTTKSEILKKYLNFIDEYDVYEYDDANAKNRC